MKKILIYLCLLFTSFLFLSIDASAAAVNIPGTTEIQDVSLNIGSSWNAIADISNTGFRVLRIVKTILMWLMVIFMVYTGAMMIMSMWSDEEQLSSAKRQIWYAAVALIFINIPGTIYEAFYKNGDTTVGSSVSTSAFWDNSTESTGNLFFDFFVFGHTLNNQIVLFLEIIVFLGAIFMLTLAGISLMTSRGREEKMKEAKNKILYTVLALVFVGIIEAWKRVAFDGEISDGVNLFQSLANLALFFAAPVAIFFLTLAGYYFITSNGDEERVKKAKSIIINTILATLILLAGYTFLIDLATL